MSDANDARRLRVLVADDHPVRQLVARRLLERDGHAVTPAHDGETALRLFEAARFDAVLLLARLPDLHAADVARSLRTMEAERGLSAARIVAMVDRSDENDLERWRLAGMNDAIPRPVRSTDLARVLSADQPALAVAGRGTGCDLERALTRAGGNEALLREVAALCVESMPGHVRTIEEALAAGDGLRLARAAHTVKGMVANFGADAAADSARRLQEAAGAESLSRARDEWSRLRAQLDDLVAELTGMTAGVAP